MDLSSLLTLYISNPLKEDRNINVNFEHDLVATPESEDNIMTVDMSVHVVLAVIYLMKAN
jgi:hypothetical protein